MGKHNLSNATYAVCLALCAQPDAKVANGMYWTNVWLMIARNLIQYLA